MQLILIVQVSIALLVEELAGAFGIPSVLGLLLLLLAPALVLVNGLVVGAFAQRWQERDAAALLRTAQQARVGVVEADRERLAQAVAELTAGRAVSAEEFSRRAEDWLRKNHRYSLSPRVPDGEGDPLVRWLVSPEAGHCELFNQFVPRLLKFIVRLCEM